MRQKNSELNREGQDVEGIEKVPSILGTLTEDKIIKIHQKIDKDNNGTIEYSEFLAHSLTDEHLSEKNVRLFFDVMLPS